MPSSKRSKPLYQRGQFALHRRPDRSNLEIVWYDHGRKRERSASAGTSSLEEGRLAVDRKFLAAEGTKCCPTCGRAWEVTEAPMLLNLLADYLLDSEKKAGAKATRTRLRHVIRFISETNPAATAVTADESFANRFRTWMSEQTARGGQRGGAPRPYSISTVEGCLLQLRAAINATLGQKAAFKVGSMKEAANSPGYRADVKTIAAMFRYCIAPEDASVRHWRAPEVANQTLVTTRRSERANLLRYLQAAVATWARPDAIYDLTDRQWYRDAKVLDLNPPNRRQTKKFRPKVPIAKQFAPHLDQLQGQWLPVTSIRGAWDRMAKSLGLPGHGEAGEKLIRRSMSTIVRKRIGEERWRQGEMFLGHVKASISDIYAIPDAANLGLALEATEQVIDEIEALAPGAFTAVLPQKQVSKKPPKRP